MKKVIADKTAENLTLEKDIDKLNVKLKEEVDAKSATITELVLVRTQLDQQDSMVRDLMNRLENQHNDSNSSEKHQPKLLVIAGKHMIPTLDRLKLEGIHWDKYTETQGLDDLHDMLMDQDHSEKLHNYDMILIALGMEDIRSGMEGFVAFRKLDKSVKKLCELECDVAVMQLPPMIGRGYTDITMFNLKLETLVKEKGVKVIQYEDKIKRLTNDKIFRVDGISLQPGALNIMAPGISEQLTDLEKKSKLPLKPLSHESANPKAMKKTAEAKGNDSESESESDKEEDMFVIDSEFTGLVIGKEGNTIRKLQSTTKTTMSVIKFQDKINGKQSAGVLIKGATEGIEIAKTKLKELIDGATVKYRVNEKMAKRGNQRGLSPLNYKKRSK
jgi:hypothetical protein